jgi:hypothetical protein
MPNLLTRLMLFLSSYAPLFMIIAMRAWNDNRRVAIGCLATSALSLLVLFLFLRAAQSIAASKISIASVKSRDGDVMSYIVTYLLPFLAVKLGDPKDVMSLGLLLLVVGLLYVNSNMIYTNPALNIAGYHIFEVEDGDGKVSALLCKRSYVRNGSELHVISIGDYVLLEKQ